MNYPNQSPPTNPTTVAQKLENLYTHFGKGFVDDCLTSGQTHLDRKQKELDGILTLAEDKVEVFSAEIRALNDNIMMSKQAIMDRADVVKEAKLKLEAIEEQYRVMDEKEENEIGIVRASIASKTRDMELVKGSAVDMNKQVRFITAYLTGQDSSPPLLSDGPVGEIQQLVVPSGAIEIATLSRQRTVEKLNFLRNGGFQQHRFFADVVQKNPKFKELVGVKKQIKTGNHGRSSVADLRMQLAVLLGIQADLEAILSVGDYDHQNLVPTTPAALVELESKANSVRAFLATVEAALDSAKSRNKRRADIELAATNLFQDAVTPLKKRRKSG